MCKSKDCWVIDENTFDFKKKKPNASLSIVRGEWARAASKKIKFEAHEKMHKLKHYEDGQRRVFVWVSDISVIYIYLIYLVLIYKRILLVRLPVHKHNEYVRIYVYFYLILDRDMNREL